MDTQRLDQLLELVETLHNTIQKYEIEKEYIEGLIIATTGPMDEVLADYQRTRLNLNNLRREMAAVGAEIQKLRDQK